MRISWLLALAVLLAPPAWADDIRLTAGPGCNAAASPCRLTGEGMEIRFRMPGGAPAMRPFPVVVEVSGPAAAELGKLEAEFVMPDMDMGQNRYRLVKQDDGRWVAQVILPACSMGRHDWLARLVLEGAGRRWLAEIPFQETR
ncbi:MAG TPA: hypothetical protein ENJ05_03635 [Thiotrichales bacterium]|nr:hypothetical protein [Thiotrichales bacterium]